MEYYTYISETTIDMLYGQLETVATPDPGSNDVYAKLTAVHRHLAKQHRIGCLEDAMGAARKPYVVDEGMWKPLLIGKTFDEDLQRDPLAQAEPQPTSFLVYTERDGILVLLVASPRNVVGVEGLNYCLVSPSFQVDDYIKRHSPYYWKAGRGPREGCDITPAVGGAIDLLAWVWQVPARPMKVFFRVYDCHASAAEVEKEVRRSERTYRVPLVAGEVRSLIIGSPVSVAFA